MTTAALDSFMHALMANAVPVIILFGAGALLVREALLRFARSIDHDLESHRSGGKTEWTHYIPSNDKSDAPPCPSCHCEMVKRKVREGANTGLEFWGCPNYPGCRETQDVT